MIYHPKHQAIIDSGDWLTDSILDDVDRQLNCGLFPSWENVIALVSEIKYRRQKERTVLIYLDPDTHGWLIYV